MAVFLSFVVSVALATPASAQGGRFNDVINHWAGARITVPQDRGFVMNCTAGFKVEDSFAREFQVTAKHCFPQNGVVGQQLSNGAGRAWGNGVAKVAGKHDALMFNSASSPRFYTGDLNSTASRIFNKYEVPEGGDSGYCISGQTSGEVCPDFRVVNTNDAKAEAKWFPKTTHVGRLRAACRCEVTGSGDSGAPVYRYLPGTTKAVLIGMYIGRDLDVPGDIIYEQILDLSSAFNVSISLLN